MGKLLSAADYAERVLSGHRGGLARAITLIESSHPEHQAVAVELIQALLPHTGNARRIGISGVPGVGKSTFIETLGQRLTDSNQTLAVLAVDPSSTRSGGSILGDKTRMPALANNTNAYIRPSPSAGTLGGVTRKTRETMLLCEAAGFDTILVETVGVGQSEVSIADMVDFYLVLMLPGAGDELQGIKKGILEIADMIVVNKADPGNEAAARSAASTYERALHILTPLHPDWIPPVMTVSALHNIGTDQLLETMGEFFNTMTHNGELTSRRQQQQVNWMWSLVEEHAITRYRHDPRIQADVKAIEHEVTNGLLSAVLGFQAILKTADRH